MKKFVAALSLLLATVGAILSFNTVFALHISPAQSANMDIKVIQDTTFTVRFYKLYNNSSGWYMNEDKTVPAGGKVTCPALTKDGFTLKGWSINVPDMNHYTETYTVEQLNNLPITQNLTLYPILQSNNNQVWINALGIVGDENADITISTSTIGQTIIGKSYVGIDKIPVAVASWNDNRNLHTASGIYKFTSSNNAALVKRKLGFKPNPKWSQNKGSGTPAFFVHTWGVQEEDILLGNTLIDGKVYGYIDARNINFIMVRKDHSATSFSWTDCNQSANLSFDPSWWWGGSSSNHYSSSTIVLNKWDDWMDGWGSDQANWIA
ncbi:MAG: hypothetical protein MJ227_02110 [Bacilli bacterium]|nr:hypothetical protein [Bacilli bacterium]